MRKSRERAINRLDVARSLREREIVEFTGRRIAQLGQTPDIDKKRALVAQRVLHKLAFQDLGCADDARARREPDGVLSSCQRAPLAASYLTTVEVQSVGLFDEPDKSFVESQLPELTGLFVIPCFEPDQPKHGIDIALHYSFRQIEDLEGAVEIAVGRLDLGATGWSWLVHPSRALEARLRQPREKVLEFHARVCAIFEIS